MASPSKSSQSTCLTGRNDIMTSGRVEFLSPARLKDIDDIKGCSGLISNKTLAPMNVLT